jgi:hypothetical protein
VNKENEGFQGGGHTKRKGINYGNAEKTEYRTKDKTKKRKGDDYYFENALNQEKAKEKKGKTTKKTKKRR